MADKQLDDLFDDFDRRKYQDAKASGERATEEKAERARAVELLKDRVIPAVTTLAEQCIARGHKAKVSHKLDDSWPNVTFEFTAEQRVKGPPINLASRIVFTGAGGTVEAKFELTPKTGREKSQKVALDELNADWVCGRARELVKAALESA